MFSVKDEVLRGKVDSMILFQEILNPEYDFKMFGENNQGMSSRDIPWT